MTQTRVLRRLAPLAVTAVLIACVGLRADGRQAGQSQSTSQSTPPVTSTAEATTTRTTAAGVYTSAQARRGEQTFSNNCVGCHSRDAYTEAGFKAAWNGKPLSALFSLVSETMPEDFPGALSPNEYADVLAFMLQLNRQPTGEQELPANADALEAITLTFGS